MKSKEKLLLVVALYAFVWLPPMAGIAEVVAASSQPLPKVAPEEGVTAEVPTEELLERAIQAYGQADFQETIGFLDQALENEGNTDEQLAALHKYKALA